MNNLCGSSGVVSMHSESARRACPTLAKRSISFRVPSVPVAQPRPRASSFGGKVRVHEVTTIKNPNTGERKPHPIAAFKATVRLAAQSAYPGSPLTGPLRVDIVAVFPRPASKIWKTREMPRIRHTCKPDRDNIDKSILDALKGTTFVDDAQVCAGSIEKWYAAGDEQPCVSVEIVEL